MRGKKGFDFARCIAAETFFRHQFEKDMAYDFVSFECSVNNVYTVKKILCAMNDILFLNRLRKFWKDIS